MFTVGVKEHILIAHSLRGEIFGPAQKLHGCTYVVDAEFKRSKLDSNGIVVDIGLAGQILKDVLQKLNYKNLDELPEYKNTNTTTEFLAKAICDDIVDALAKHNINGIEIVKITLHESHVAWASYEKSLS